MRFGCRPLLLWIATASTAHSWTPLPLTVRRFHTNSAHHFKPALARLDTRISRTTSSLRMASSATPSDSLRTLRVALCQTPVTSSKEQNIETARKYLDNAAQNGAQMVVLPEIWNSPYATAAFPEYAETMPEISDSTAPLSPSSTFLLEMAKKNKMWIVGGSIPERVSEGDSEKYYNTCLVINPEGTIVAKHRKVHLFDIDVPGGITFFESETLSPGQTVSHFGTPFGEIGVGICYDIRFAEYAMLLRQKHNCCILIYPGAFNMTTGPAHWELLQRARALDNQCFVLTASPARTPAPTSGDSKYPHYTAWGHSTVVSPWGDVVATTDENEGIVFADLDLSRVEEIRKGIPIGNQRRNDLYELQGKGP